MGIPEAHLMWILSFLLLAGLFLAYPALTTAIALLCAERSVGNYIGPLRSSKSNGPVFRAAVLLDETAWATSSCACG